MSIKNKINLKWLEFKEFSQDMYDFFFLLYYAYNKRSY